MIYITKMRFIFCHYTRQLIRTNQIILEKKYIWWISIQLEKRIIKKNQ